MTDRRVNPTMDLPEVCHRWGWGDQQCLMPAFHLGPCVLNSGPTLPVYHGPAAGPCTDCGKPVAQPWSRFCTEHLTARFGNE